MTFLAEEARQAASAHLENEVPRQVQRCLEAIKEEASLGALNMQYFPGDQLMSNPSFRRSFTQSLQSLGFKVSMDSKERYDPFITVSWKLPEEPEYDSSVESLGSS